MLRFLRSPISLLRFRQPSLRSFLSTAANAPASEVLAVNTITEVLDDDESMSVDDFRKLHHIKLQGETDCQYTPFTSFQGAPFPDKLKNALLKQGYKKPTATQAQSWPIGERNTQLSPSFPSSPVFYLSLFSRHS